MRLISAFVDHYRSGPPLRHPDVTNSLDPALLSLIMLNPIKNKTIPFDRENAKSAYCASILMTLAPWTHEQNFDFFDGLFATMGKLSVAPSSKSLATLSQLYLSTFGPRLGELLGQLKASADVDRWFVMDAASRDKRSLFASRLSSKRALHPVAAMAVMGDLDDLGDMITFLERTWIEIDDDTAEKIAFMLGRFKWSRQDAELVLQAKLPRAVFRALTRQIMEHPDQSRLARLIEWRDADRGAAGGLSLEDLFSAFKSFDVAIRTAERIAPNLGLGQLSAIVTALTPLASSKKEKDRLQSLMPSRPYISPNKSSSDGMPPIPKDFARRTEYLKKLS